MNPEASRLAIFAVVVNILNLPMASLISALTASKHREPRPVGVTLSRFWGENKTSVNEPLSVFVAVTVAERAITAGTTNAPQGDWAGHHRPPSNGTYGIGEPSVKQRNTAIVHDGEYHQ